MINDYALLLSKLIVANVPVRSAEFLLRVYEHQSSEQAPSCTMMAGWYGCRPQSAQYHVNILTRLGFLNRLHYRAWALSEKALSLNDEALKERTMYMKTRNGKKTDRKLPVIVGPAAKILDQTDDITTFRVVGIPFGGPDYLQGKDLHGEYFGPDTDYGMKTASGEVKVPVIYSYYDHALNDSIGTKRIGFAKFYEQTDEGLVFDIEVERAFRYHDLLLTLAQKDLLGASSQPVQTSVEIDYSTGKILQWHPAEISLTPTPANPKAVVSAIKSFLAENSTDEDFAEEIKAMFAEDEDTQDPDEPQTEDVADDEDTQEAATFSDEEVKSYVNALATMLEEVLAEVKSLREELAEVRSSQEEKSATILAETLKNRAGIRAFADSVATKLKIQTIKIAEELNGDGNEPENEDEQDPPAVPPKTRKSSVIPAGAPGLT